MLQEASESFALWSYLCVPCFCLQLKLKRPSPWSLNTQPSAHGSPVADGGNVQVLHPFFLYMVTGEGRGTKSFLRLVHWFPLRYAQDKSSLIGCSCSRSYSVTSLPSPMDPLTRIQKVQLHNLWTLQPRNFHWLLQQLLLCDNSSPTAP